MSIIKLEKQEICNAMPLFGEIPLGWDVMLAAAKDFGFFLADDRNEPNVALAFIGGCMVYGGDASHKNAQALVEAMAVQPLILPYPREWANLVREVFADKVTEETRFFLPFSSLEHTKLAGIKNCSGYELRKMDMELAARLESEMHEVAQLHHYASLQDFVDRGCSFCVVKGNEICAMAIAFLRGDSAIQIQISTKEQYRRRGLATMVGAALLRHCIENGIRASWDASNPGSRDLAVKLGYTQCTSYEALSILPRE